MHGKLRLFSARRDRHDDDGRGISVAAVILDDDDRADAPLLRPNHRVKVRLVYVATFHDVTLRPGCQGKSGIFLPPPFDFFIEAGIPAAFSI